ncbi:MAG: exo-alpha-sialidase [Acidobacteria bacterium]|nr:exo-alpha-sialidase [Acidobacteriota bacterium]
MYNDKKTLLSFALPMVLGVACVLQPVKADAQMTSVGVDCSQIAAKGIMMQDNMRAGRVLIECGVVRAGQPADSIEAPLSPPNIQVSDRACVDGASCTKSESAVWASTKDNGKTIVVNYNDHNPGGSLNYTGTSVSKDGGVTFKQLIPPPFSTGHGDNFGDPIVVFNSKLNKWFAGDLADGCGGQGIAIWSSKLGLTWKVGACAHNGAGDDRESMWVDNDPTSGTYGRMYISWNDFNNNGALSVTHSDNGTAWSAPAILNPNFIRDVQVTGSPRGAARFEGTNSTVFVAAMDEGGGGFANRQNIMYKSLDGGVTWTSSTMGPAFKPVGQGSCDNPYFVKVNPIWRHMGWGEPAVGPNGVVHYAYAGLGKKTDPGDIFYVRSVDNGKTWSTPIKLNPDKGTKFRTQWMPSVSSDLNGKVTVSWYDRRAATTACNVASDPGCSYERVGIQSADNGATFQPAITISSAIIQQPAQNDPGVQACYAGDYDYATAFNGNAYVTWTDGRVKVGTTQVQNVDFAAVPLP